MLRESMERGCAMTTLSDKSAPTAGREAQRLHDRLRAMTITVVVLAVALVGLGAWVICDQASRSDTAATSDIQKLLDSYTTAWNDDDSDAFVALVTDDYRFSDGGAGAAVEQQAATISRLGGLDWNVEAIGDPVVSGDGPYYCVAQSNHTTSLMGDADGISVFTIVERDGVYLIDSHVHIGGQ